LLRVNTPEKNERGFEEAKEALKCLVRGAEVTPCGGHRISRNLLTQSRARELLTKISPSLRRKLHTPQDLRSTRVLTSWQPCPGLSACLNLHSKYGLLGHTMLNKTYE
jgi:hypothetical protein